VSANVSGLKANWHGGTFYPLDRSLAGCRLVLDFDDVIVHVFHNETREHYNLDGLWADAPRVTG